MPVNVSPLYLTPSHSPGWMMHSPLLLLLLSCPWPVCSRRPQSHSIERDQPLYSLERDQPLHFLQKDQPSRSLKNLHTIKRSQTKKMRSPKSSEDIGCLPANGTAYTGKANTTESGLTCQMWSVNTPQEHPFNDTGEHNYCRDLAGAQVPWCYTTDPGMRWEYCNVPLCVTETQTTEEIGCKPTDGTLYTGHANTTIKGRTCQMWSVNTPHESYHPEVGEHNYCRSPDGDALWCYTTDPGKGWEYCEVPDCVIQTKSVEDVDCVPKSGEAYTGKANTTVSGRTCQMWSVDTPHPHSFNDVGEQNYCRDPAGVGLFCFTTDVKMRWEYCDVPVCITFTKGI